MIAVRILIDLLLLAGLYFCLAGTIGVLKMPDAFSRMQASTCIPTMGIICVCLAGILYAAFVKGSAADAVKILLIGVMVVVTNPIGSRAIAKGAYKCGIRPEKDLTPDDYGRDFEEDE